MRGLVFVLLAAAVVASVQGTRYRGPRFINLGITGLLAPVYAGNNRDTLNRFGSISGTSLSRTFGSTFLAGSAAGRRRIGLSSVYPYSRSATIRGVAPFSGGIRSYNEFGGVPLSGFGPGGGLGSGDSVDPYPEGPLDGPSHLNLGFLNGDGPLTDDGLYNGDGVLTGSGSFDGIRALRGGQISGGFFTGGNRPLGYEYEASLARIGAGSVYQPYRRLNGLSSLYPNPYAHLYNGHPGVSGFDDDFSVSGGGLGLNFNLGGGDELGFSTHPGVSGFGGDLFASSASAALDSNNEGGDGLGFSTQFDALELQWAPGRD